MTFYIFWVVAHVFSNAEFRYFSLYTGVDGGLSSLSICVLVMAVSRANMAEPIEMPFSGTDSCWLCEPKSPAREV